MSVLNMFLYEPFLTRFPVEHACVCVSLWTQSQKLDSVSSENNRVRVRSKSYIYIYTYLYVYIIIIAENVTTRRVVSI